MAGCFQWRCFPAGVVCLFANLLTKNYVFLSFLPSRFLVLLYRTVKDDRGNDVFLRIQGAGHKSLPWLRNSTWRKLTLRTFKVPHACTERLAHAFVSSTDIPALVHDAIYPFGQSAASVRCHGDGEFDCCDTLHGVIGGNFYRDTQGDGISGSWIPLFITFRLKIKNRNWCKQCKCCP